MYAGKTASLPDHTASPPMPKRRKRMYFASSSETRPPKRRKKRGVRNGNTKKITILATTNTTVFRVKGEKISPRAITVPRSLTKHAARMALPNSVTLKPISSITAYTTATEVDESATPASQLEGTLQCNT